jgi:hypothetical protein
MRATIVLTAMALLAASAAARAADTVGTVEVLDSGAVQPGHAAYVDPTRGKIVEITPDGHPTWEFTIPSDVIGTGDLGLAADIEWLPATDHFLFVVPRAGVFEVDRAKHIVWSYRTKHVTHDADRLPNGNTIFVNGADEDDDPTVTEVDGDGKVVFQWFARGKLDKKERRDSPSEREYSFTHANAVQRLANGSTMVSLRNFFRFVILDKDAIVFQSGQIPWVHDPVVLPDATYFSAHGKEVSAVVRVGRDGKRARLFVDKSGRWVLLRTVEPLRNGNVLITGARRIGQINPQGRLVWSIRLDGFPDFDPMEAVRKLEALQRSGASRPDSFGMSKVDPSRANKRAALYKAAWVYK